MRKSIKFIIVLSFSFLLVACGIPEIKEGEVVEITHDEFDKLMESEDEQPFLLITTSANDKAFDTVARKSFEDSLSKKNEGAFYLNLEDADSKEVESINDYGQDYDATSDGLVLVQNGSIEKTDVRLHLSEDVLENATTNEEDFSKIQQSDIEKDIEDSVADLTTRK